MKKFKFKALAVATLFILLTGCSATKSGHLHSSQIRDAYEALCTGKAQVQYCAIGMANAQDIYTSRELALDNARLNLAKQIQVKMKSLDETYSRHYQGKILFEGGETNSQYLNNILVGMTPDESSAYFEETQGEYQVQILMTKFHLETRMYHFS